MHSSISSSSDRIPQRSGLVIVVGAALAAAGLLAWEWTVRSGGADEVSVPNNGELWISERQRASTLGKEALILVGASRMQGGLDLDVLASETDAPVAQLAITASPFLPVLRDLADDPAIVGTVVVSMDMAALRIPETGSQAVNWIRTLRQGPQDEAGAFYQPFEDTLSDIASTALASLNSSTSPWRFFFGETDRSYVRTLPDRSQRYDYSLVDQEAAYRRRLEMVGGVPPRDRIIEIPDADDRFQELHDLTGEIQARGGRVVFVRFPSSKGILDVERVMYPRTVYWDRFTLQSPAISIHFEDVPGLQGFNLPDGLHLDAADQPAFSRAFSKVLTDALRDAGE